MKKTTSAISVTTATLAWMLLLIAGGPTARAEPTSTTLAVVNGKSITEKDLTQALGGMNEGQRQTILKDLNMRREIVQNLIEQEVLVQQAEKDKLDQSPEYKEALDQFRKQYLSNKLLEKNLGDKADDKAAKAYFKTHANKFGTSQVHAQHILVATEEQAKEMLKKAKEPNADFQALAEANSKDPSAKNNRGDLGFFTRDRMVPEFADAAFDAAPGSVVGPVKTAYGYHVIKVLEKKEGKPLEYDEVEMRVKGELRQELIKNYVGKLRGQAKIEIKSKDLEKM